MSHSFEEAMRIHALKTLLANLSMSADVREQVMKFAMNDGDGCNDATYLSCIHTSAEFCASYVFGTNKWNQENLLMFLQAAFRQCKEAPYVVNSLLDTLELVRGSHRSIARTQGGSGVATPGHAHGPTSRGQVGQQVSPHRTSPASGATANTDSRTTVTDPREGHTGAAAPHSHPHSSAHHQHQQLQQPLLEQGRHARPAPPQHVSSRGAQPSRGQEAANPMYALAEATAARLQNPSPMHIAAAGGEGRAAFAGGADGGASASADSISASTQKLSAAVEGLRQGRPSLGSGTKRALHMASSTSSPPATGITAAAAAASGPGSDWAVNASGRGATPVQAQGAEAFPTALPRKGAAAPGGGGGGTSKGGGMAAAPVPPPPAPGVFKASRASTRGEQAEDGDDDAGIAIDMSEAGAQAGAGAGGEARPAKKSRLLGREESRASVSSGGGGGLGGSSRGQPAPSPSPSPSPPAASKGGRQEAAPTRTGTGSGKASNRAGHLPNGKPSTGMLGKAAWEYKREPPKCFGTVSGRLCSAYSRAAEKRGQAKEVYLSKVVATCIEALVEYLHEEGGSKDEEDQEWIARGKRWLALLQMHPHALTDVHTPGLWSTGQWPPDHVCGVYSVRKEDAHIPPMALPGSSSSDSSSGGGGSGSKRLPPAHTTHASAREVRKEEGEPPALPAAASASSASATTTPPSTLPSLSFPAPSRTSTVQSVDSAYNRARRAAFGSMDLGPGGGPGGGGAGSGNASPAPTPSVTDWLAGFKERRLGSQAHRLGTDSSTEAALAPAGAASGGGGPSGRVGHEAIAQGQPSSGAATAQAEVIA